MIETLHVGIIVVVDSVCVEQLASVVGVVPCFLEPHGKIVLIESLADEFGVTTWQKRLAVDHSN